MVKNMDKPIPILNNRAFLDRFGNERAFFSTIDIERFTIVPLETSWQGLRWAFPFPAVRSTSHDFIFITQGTTIRQRGIDLYRADAGKILFMPAFQISRVMDMSQDIKGFFVNFSDSFLSDKTGQSQPLGYFSFWQPEAPALWEIPTDIILPCAAILQRLYEDTQQTHPERESIAAHRLMAFFFFIKPYLKAMAIGPVTDTGAGSLSQRYKHLLSHSFDPKKSIADYAAMLHVTPNHLNKSVRAAMGKTSSDLLDEHRLLEAKVLIHQSNLPLGVIAEQLGFADLTHFGRFFKKKTGKNPSNFKKMIDKAD
jgi:AraC family transcriptional regulator, transcriptional activator of pobA